LLPRLHPSRILGASTLTALAICVAMRLFPVVAHAADGLFPFASLRIAETGEFAETSAGTYAFTRNTAVIRPGRGVAFGVAFTLEGGLSGRTVLVEARLVGPPPLNGEEEIQAPARWLIPAVIGESAQAVYLLPEESPQFGPWSLALYYGNEKLSETRFDLQPAIVPETPGKAASAAPDASASLSLPEKVPAAPAQKVEEQAAKPAKSNPKASTPSQTVFTIQTGLFSVLKNARRQAEAVRAQGFSSCILKEGEGKDLRYRVLAGRYLRKALALKNRARLVAAGTDAVVKSFPAARLDKASCR